MLEALPSCFGESGDVLGLSFHYRTRSGRINALNEAGGWKDHTTMEDMDLAIRVQASRWQRKVWPRQIWPSDKGPEFHDTPGAILTKLNPGKFIPNNTRVFSYAELYITTKGFCKDELLGSGGFGRVYKVVLPSDGSIVAVKCISKNGKRSSLEKTFEAELATAG